MRKIIDAHAHITHEVFDQFANALENSELTGVNIISVPQYYPSNQSLSLAQKLKERTHKDIYFTASLGFEDLKNNAKMLQSNEVSCVKIHPRIQGLSANQVKELVKKASELGINKPIIIDMFPYRSGNYRISENTPTAYEELLQYYPNQKFVFAHFGGIYLREVFMMMKCYPNLFADTSLITRYFRNSPLLDELFYFIHRLEGNRVLFGSDFPEIEFQENIDLHNAYFKKAGVKSRDVEKIFSSNYLELIS